jgi:hypothetical protein
MGFDSGGGGGSTPDNVLTTDSVDDSRNIATSFGETFQVDPDYPGIVVAITTAVTNGSSAGEISLDVDEGSPFPPSYTLTASKADPALGIDGGNTETTVTVLPSGATGKLVNTSDPTNANTINQVRGTTLNPDL